MKRFYPKNNGAFNGMEGPESESPPTDMTRNYTRND